MNIYNSIKSACLRSLRLPAVIITICIGILIACPFLDVFHPTEVDDIYRFKKEEAYVSTTVPTLYYTGYDLVGFPGRKYGYYYSLEKDQCVFVIIPISDTPKETLSNYYFKAKVKPFDNSFLEMIDSFSKDLNWDKASLLNVTKTYILSNSSYHPIFYMILFWIILIVLLSSLKNFIQALIGFINPNYYPVCSFLGKTVQQELLTEAQEELSDSVYIQINEMYITENYFIDLGREKISVIPLSDIIWCYRLGSLSLSPRNHEHNYSINFTIRSGAMISIPDKTSDEALELINAIRATEYDIIIGHSEAKKRLAKKRVIQ